MTKLKPITLALALAAMATPALAQTTSGPAPYGAPIGLTDAQALIERAVAASSARGFRMAIAIVEPSGELVAFARMDDTQYGSIYVAQRKAETAARYRGTTAAMEARVQGGRMVSLANADSLPIAGGVPILVDGRIVGAIGVSGAAAADDDAIAIEALKAP